MNDGTNLRWIWIANDGKWGEIDQLHVVDADDELTQFLDKLNADGKPEGVANIGAQMGTPLAAIVPPLPRSNDASK